MKAHASRSRSRVTTTSPAVVSRIRLTVRANDAVADPHRPVPMAERQIVGGSGGDLFVAKHPGRPQRVGAGLGRLVVAVRHRYLPAGRAGARAAQRRHAEIVAMGVPPDFEIVCRERNGFVMGYSEDADVWESRQPAADKNRVGKCRVVIAGKNHDRQPRLGEQLSGAIEHGRA